MNQMDELNKIMRDEIDKENKKASRKITLMYLIGVLILLAMGLYFTFKIAIPLQNQLDNLMNVLK